MVYEVQLQPFRLKVLSFVDRVGELLSQTSFLCMDEMLSCFLPTTEELKTPQRRLPHLIILPFVYLTFAVATCPFGIAGFLIRCILSWIRAPYRVYVNESLSKMRKLHHSFATANLCLGPEWLCRWNNLGGNVQRAAIMGHRLSSQQYKLPQSNSSFHRNGVANHHHGNQLPRLGTSTGFPPLDVICFQEVFDRRCAETFIENIRKVFPHVLYDARVPGVFSDFLNSGLMIASRHEITHVHFHPFPVSAWTHRFINKGVLMCKVLLSVDERTGTREVGYIATTHLQPYHGNTPIVRQQLTSLYQAVSHFRSATISRGDHVMYDVIAGDFNFDNMSPGDQPETNHPIFSSYTDVCRIRPGLDRNWAIGTERRHITLHDDDTKTAGSLKHCLDDPSLLRLHVLDADVIKSDSAMLMTMPDRDEFGGCDVSMVGGRRRVDYCLYNIQDGPLITGYNFVTQFSNLTDHIAVSMTLMSSITPMH